MLSIITPCLNSDKTLQRCIESIAYQLVPELEHIIIDGNSTDTSQSILKTASQQYSHLRFVSEPDSGQSAALNKGIRLARHQLIGILNADDYYASGTLPRVTKLSEKLSCPSVIMGNCRVLDNNGHLSYLNRPRCASLRQLLSGRGTLPHNPSAYFYHKQLHDLVGHYDENEQYLMDFDFLLRAIAKVPVHYFDEEWGNFCLTSETKTYEILSTDQLRHRLYELARKHIRKQPFLVRSYLSAFLSSKQLWHWIRNDSETWPIRF